MKIKKTFEIETVTESEEKCSWNCKQLLHNDRNDTYITPTYRYGRLVLDSDAFKCECKLFGVLSYVDLPDRVLYVKRHIRCIDLFGNDK